MKRLALLAVLLSACTDITPLLRLIDLGSHKTRQEHAVSRARALTGMSDPVIWHDPMFVAPGEEGSQWSYDHGPYTFPMPWLLPDGQGGVARWDSGTGVDGYSYTAMAPYAKSVGIVGDLSAGAKHYQLHRFRVPATSPNPPIGAIRLGLGTWSNGTITVGIRPPSSTTHFRFSGKAGAGALSSVAIDSAWHDVEMWTTGVLESDGQYHFYGSIDGEPFVHFPVGTWGTSLFPWIIVANGNATEGPGPVQLDVDDAIYVVPGAN